MTLSRQLITLITITFLLIFSGTIWISVENTRSYLMLQLETQTQNAADSLGLSLAPYMRQRDIAAMDTMINALFDSGYYKSLHLERIGGTTLIERKNTSRIEGVPQWFIDHLTLETPAAESIITDGWTQASRLRLTAHPGFAYKKLWDTTIQTLWWSLLAFITALAAVLLLLRAILRPLRAVEQQALAIADRQFPVVERIPRTRELRRVVVAMNAMSAKMKTLIGRLSARAEELQRQAHYDALTGLLNRRGFEARFEHIIRDRESGGSGALAVVRIVDLANYNRRFGHQAGSELLTGIAALLTRLGDAHPHAAAARITGTDFAVLLPLLDRQAATAFGAALSAGLNDLAATLQIDDIAHAGIAAFSEQSRPGAVLASADAALSRAEQKGANTCIIQDDSDAGLGNEAWRQLISNVLGECRIHLMAQPVESLSTTGDVLYHELLIRIDAPSDGAEPLSPALFAAMAERVDMHEQLDRHIITMATDLLQRAPSRCLGVNLSTRSICSDRFRSWLDSHLAALPEIADRIYVEINEYALLQHADAVKTLISALHGHGARVVIEHFGTRLSAFRNLRQLQLDALKIDGSFTRHIDSESDNRFFLHTIMDIAHGLDIRVIAEHVETDAELASLHELGIDAAQGYRLGVPEPLE